MSVGGVGNEQIDQMIHQVLQAEQESLQDMDAQKDEVQEQIEAFQEINTTVDTFKSTTQDINESTFANVAQVGNEEVLAAVAADDAEEGIYDVEVDQLAEVHREASEQQIGEIEVGGEITVENMDGDELFDVGVDSGDEAIDIANAINEAAEDAEEAIQASVVDDRIVIESLETGEENQFNVDANGVQLEDEENLEFANIQEGEDAVVEVDGLEITSSDNFLDDNEIDGVEVELLEEGETVVEVGSDEEGIRESIEGFVESYNAVVEMIDLYQDPQQVEELEDEEGEGAEEVVEGGILQGESTLRTIQSALYDSVVSPVEGEDGDLSLSQFGIQVQDDGRLAIDDRGSFGGEDWGQTLDEAIENDLDQLEEIFTSEDGIVDRVSEQVGPIINPQNGQDSFIDTRINTLESEIDQIDENIENELDSLENQEQRLRDQFTNMQQIQAEMQNQQQQMASLGGSVGINDLIGG